MYVSNCGNEIIIQLAENEESQQKKKEKQRKAINRYDEGTSQGDVSPIMSTRR